MTLRRYGLTTILLHWIIAILVIGLFFLGQIMVDLDYYDPWYHRAPWWHYGLGVCAFCLMVFRLFWKLSTKQPKPLDSYKYWEVILALLIHQLFYLVVFIICISGYIVTTAKGVGIEFFDLFEIPALFTLSEEQTESVSTVHEYSTWLMTIFVVMHVTAALKHHLIDKDDTLRRIFKPHS